MAISSLTRSSGAKICAPAAPGADFKACCLKSRRHDGSNRNDYFQGVTGAGPSGPALHLDSMRFITESEARPIFAKLGIDCRGPIAASRAAEGLKTFDIYYRSRLVVARETAELIAAGQEGFTSCLLWACALVWGDRSLEEIAPPDWARYDRWRRAQGEMRPIYAAPGHLFGEAESGLLATAIEGAIHMGWDALMVAKPAKMIIQFSHDDRITIFARTRPSKLFAELESIGLKSKRRSAA
jgi:hypothetical protein